jgi:lipopolysaccharide transport system permease protein
MFADVWGYRRYIVTGAWRELQHRYAGSAAGLLWHVVNPLAQIAIYLIVFTQIAKGHPGQSSAIAYALYLCAGILPWFVFAETLTHGSTVLLAVEGYLKKLAIPESVFVAQSVLTSGLTLALYAVALFVLALAIGLPARLAWLALPLVLLLFLGLCFGISLLLGTLTVFFRDLAQAMGIASQLWFWATPVIYDPSLLRGWMHTVALWNPPTVFIMAVREVLIVGRLPAAADWAWMVALCAGSLAVGASVLDRLRSDLRDAL